MKRRNIAALAALSILWPMAFTACEKGAPPPEKSKQQAAMSAPGKGQHLGDAFTTKQPTELSKLMENPSAYVGKTVRIQGVVVAFCHHRRAWFALATKPKSPLIRVKSLPKFPVPEGVEADHTVAETEGVVSLQTVPEAYARHMAKEHGMFGGNPDQVQGPQQLLSMNATGARFEITR